METKILHLVFWKKWQLLCSKCFDIIFLISGFTNHMKKEAFVIKLSTERNSMAGFLFNYKASDSRFGTLLIYYFITTLSWLIPKLFSDGIFSITSAKKMITWLTKEIITRKASAWGTNKRLDNSSLIIVNSEHDIFLLGGFDKILRSRSLDVLFVHHREILLYSLYEGGTHCYWKDKLLWKLSEKWAWLSATGSSSKASYYTIK